MNVRAKSRRRLLILTVVSLVLMIGGSAAYIIRIQHRDARLRQSLADGIVAFEQGDHYNALHKVGAYLGRNQSDAEALYYYARAREQVEEPNNRHIPQAIRLYLRLLDLQPNHREARQHLLKLYATNGFNAETIATADELLAADGRNVEAMKSKAVALFRMRRFDEALKCSLVCNDLAPLDLESQLFTLEILQRKGEGPAALTRRSQSLLEANPDHPVYQLLHSMSCAMARDREAAVEWARAAAAHQRHEPQVLVQLVHHLSVLELYDDATAVLERAAASESSPQIQRLAIGRLWQAGRDEDVIRRLQGLDPAAAGTDAELASIKSLALHRSGRTADAAPIARALEGRGDNTAKAWAALLTALFAQPADHSAIISAAHEAMEVLPESPYIHFYLADGYAAVGESELALQHWMRARAAAPAWRLPLIRMSRLLSAGGAGVDAVALAEAARKQAPDDLEVLTALAIAQAASLNAASADLRPLLELVNLIQKRAPRQPDTLPLYIMLLVRTGEEARAKQVLAEALAASPALSEAMLLNLAQVSRQLNLGLEQQCYDRCREIHGVGANPALAQAVDALRDGDAAKGMEVLASAREAAAAEGQSRQWRMVWARYLELAGDERAAGEWMALARDLPGDREVQWQALTAASVRSDRAFRGETLERLAKLSGRHGVRLRMERVDYLLEGQPAEAQLVEASELLSSIVRDAPESERPRRLLAHCMERLGNLRGAIEQLNIASNLRPDSNSILLELARLQQRQGDFELARRHIDRALQSTALSRQERRTAAQLLASQGDSAQALSLIEAELDPDTVTPDLVLASLYRQRNQLDKAEAVYKALLAQELDGGVIATAADFYASTGRLAEAEALLARLDKVQLHAGAAQLIRGDFYSARGDLGKALAQYQSAVSAERSSGAAWRRLILCQLMMGDGIAAVTSARAAAAARPDDPIFSTLIQHAALVQQLAPEQESRSLLMSLVQSPADAAPGVDALYLLAEEKRQTASPLNVITKLRSVADRHPRNLPLQMLLTRRYIASNRLDDAVTLATRTMQLFPTAAEPAELAAGALAAAGRWQEALTVASQWRQRTLANPLSADLLIAAAHLQLRNPARSLEQLAPHLPQAMANPQEGETVLMLQVQALIASSDFKTALELLFPLAKEGDEWRRLAVQLAGQVIPDTKVAALWLDEIAALTPDAALGEQLGIAEARFHLFRRSNRAEDRTAAQRALDAVVTRMSMNSEVPADWMLAAGSLYERDENLAEAERAYRRAIERDPDHPIALNNAAYVILTRSGDLAEAAQLATKAVQGNPKVPAFHDTLAWIRAAEGDSAAALSAMETAAQLDPDNIVWKINRAKLLADAGRVDDSRLALEELEARQIDTGALSSKHRQRLEAVRAVVQSRPSAAVE